MAMAPSAASTCSAVVSFPARPMATAPSAASASACSSAVVSFPARPAASSARWPRAAMRASAAKRSGKNGKWWAPLLGWSGKADYLEAPAPLTAKQDEAAQRQFVGVMTEEKYLLFMYMLFGGLKFHQEYISFFGSPF